MKPLFFQPIEGKAEVIIDAILRTPEVASCNRDLYAIHLVCEELVINVVSYAYPNRSDGYLKVEVIRETDGWLELRFIDGGIPFNPLEKEQPDLTLALEDRPIGGLGIFLTTQMMDSVEYARVNEENVLIIKKRISDGNK